jgi:small subunit ribosomal protein S6
VPGTLYETIFIAHPDKGGTVKDYTERFKKIVEEQGGTISQAEEWGLKDLAYRIQKQARGYYVFLRYRSEPRAVEELERNLKLSDGILRYLTVRVDEKAEAMFQLRQKQALAKVTRNEEEATKSAADPS